MKWSPEDIATLFAYTRWASQKTLESVASLSQEEFLLSIGGSFGSVQATLAHLYGADWVWLERWHGRSPQVEPPKAGELERFDVLRNRWQEVQEGQRTFVETVTPARIDEPLTFNFDGQTWTFLLGETLLHVANHGTYHRGQIATLLRQLGKTAVSTDYLHWIHTGGA